MTLDWHLILQLTIAAILIIMWVAASDRDVARATRPDAGFPWLHAALGVYDAALAVWCTVTRDWPYAVADGVVAALCARVVWHWWRRRRQGKPSRVLGLVRDLGHKLTVQAIPASDGTP